MDIELFTLCDYATNDDGRLTIVNTLDNLVVDKFPWRAYFGFALKGTIKHIRQEDTILTLSLYLKGQEETCIFNSSAPLMNKVGRFAAAGNLRGLIFEQPGEYIFKVYSNNGLCREYVFDVKLAESSATNNEN